MRVCLVSDNRDVSNWGCRATSSSLVETLSGEHEVVSTIGRLDVTRGVGLLPLGPFRSVIPRRATAALERRALPAMARYGSGRRRGRRVVAAGLSGLGHLGVCADFLEVGPEQAARTIRNQANSEPFFSRVLAAIDTADVVVINGEGSAILSEPPRRDIRFQLAMIYLATSLAKPVHFVNAMVSEGPGGVREPTVRRELADALPMCASVLLRDPESVELLGELAPGVHARFVPDALFGWSSRFEGRDAARFHIGAEHMAVNQSEVIEPTEPYVVVSGGSLAGMHWAGVIENSIPASQIVSSYVELVDALRASGLSVLLVETCSRDRFLRDVARRTGSGVVPAELDVADGCDVLAASAAIISGRYHPSIMASLGGAPFVGLEGNSHKMRSLRRVLALDSGVRVFGGVPTRGEIAEIIDHVTALIAADERQPRVERTRRLSTLARTGLLDALDAGE